MFWTLVISRCFPFSLTRRHALSPRAQVAGSRLLSVARCLSSPVFASRWRVTCECLLAGFCLWSVRAVGIFFVFLKAPHTVMYVVVTRADPGFASKFLHSDIPARDISCSLVLRAGSGQLMRIQGLRAVTKVHLQFRCTKGAQAKVYPLRRLLYRVVVHKNKLGLAPKLLVAFFRFCRQLAACVLHTNRAQMCVCVCDVGSTPQVQADARPSSDAGRRCSTHLWPGAAGAGVVGGGAFRAVCWKGLG